MPVPKGTIFRYKTLPNNKKIRLGIYKGKVIEVKTPSGKLKYPKNWRKRYGLYRG